MITKRDRIEVTRLTQDQVEKYPVMHIANNILYSAVEERASDIHIEPKEENTLVRFRIDGDMRDMFKLKKKTGDMLISRFKAMGGLDIADRRKPQDGGLEAIISERNFKMRLATTSTPDGESLVIRMLEPSVKPAPLTELGMTPEQTGLMKDLASRSQGVVLMVGPTGSGKTTTIYSFLSQIDTKSRSLITVEDPVEYRIPYANQQQVNEKAGVTFEALLKSAVRQDPDIMFLGEIRDPYSAKMALDFASSGHLTISTIHSSNAISAVFRLERLAVGRDTIADAVLAIVAQRLIKKLCPYCKKVIPATAKEQEQLAPFLNVQVEQVAHPVGCDKCGQTGYYGREGIYEVLYFDAEIAERVRSGRPLEEIRNFVRATRQFFNRSACRSESKGFDLFSRGSRVPGIGRGKKQYFRSGCCAGFRLGEDGTDPADLQKRRNFCSPSGPSIHTGG